MKGEIEAAIAAAKTVLEGDDAAAMKAESEKFQQVAMKLGQAIYEKQAQAEASPSGQAEAPKEDVVDAEFSEVDDSKA